MNVLLGMNPGRIQAASVWWFCSFCAALLINISLFRTHPVSSSREPASGTIQPPIRPHGDGKSGPPGWTTCAGWFQGFPSLFEAPSAQTPTAGGQGRKAEAAGERDPTGLPAARLQLRWMEFTVCVCVGGGGLIHVSPHPGCHSTPPGPLVSFEGSFVFHVPPKDVELKEQNGGWSLGGSLPQGAGTLSR